MAKQGDTIKIRIVWQFALSYMKSVSFVSFKYYAGKFPGKTVFKKVLRSKKSKLSSGCYSL